MPEPQYQTFSYPFVNRGLVARYALDETPAGTWLNLQNMEARQENSLSSRHGLQLLTVGILTSPLTQFNAPLADLNVHTLGRLLVKSDNVAYRYAVSGQQVYRLDPTDQQPGVFGQVFPNVPIIPTIGGITRLNNIVTIQTLTPHGILNGQAVMIEDVADVSFNGLQTKVQVSSPTGLNFTQAGPNANSVAGGTVHKATSGNRASMVVYRPDLSSAPYMFLADSAIMLKDNGKTTRNSITAMQAWGGAPPLLMPTLGFADPNKTLIEIFEEADLTSFTITNFSATSLQTRVRVSLSNADIGLSPSGIVNVNAWFHFAGLQTRAANVVTAITSTPHNLQTGAICNVFNSSDTSYNAQHATITVVDAFTITYPSVGANGSTVNGQLSYMPNIQQGMMILVDGGTANAEFIYVAAVTATGFTATFQFTHLSSALMVAHSFQGTVAAGSTASIAKSIQLNLNVLTGTSTVPTDDDLIGMFVKLDNPFNVSEIKVFFDVGDGSYTQDYYWKSISPATFQPAVAGTRVAGDVLASRIHDRAAAKADARRMGHFSEDLIPSDLDDLHRLRPKELNTGQRTWTLIQAKRSEFVKVGRADESTNNWSNVVGFKIQIVTVPNAGAVVQFDDLMLLGGSGLDCFGGEAYDYRITYYNANTGYETNASQTFIDTRTILVRRQPVQVTWTASPDPQFTHTRVYRRGGTLTQTWYKVGEVPVGTVTFKDTIADAVAIEGKQLEFDNDPPVTSTLKTPVNMAILNSTGPTNGVVRSLVVPSGEGLYIGQTIVVGSGATQETTYVSNLKNFLNLGVTVDCYCQYPHNAGEQLTAEARPQTPMNLACIAFERAWLAGDSANPHILYYSKVGRPESFPPQNFLEVGKPDDPIMGMVEFKGALYVFTLSKIWIVFGAGGTSPVAFPTAARHGLHANFGLCVSAGMIWYVSYDGVYVFSGGQETIVTEVTEWIWTGKNLGPVAAIDLSQLSETLLCFGLYNEIFISYIDQSGTRRRLIWEDSSTKKRWRNDDVPATAMLFEEDTGLSLVGQNNGMIYFDRSDLDYDDGGFLPPNSPGTPVQIPINLILQSEYQNQGSPKIEKVYNEFTLDCDTNGQDVTVDLLFENGDTVVSLGVFNSAGRTQINRNINAGLGQRGRNVSVRITGAVEQVVTFWQAHIRGTIEAEQRQSFDSYFLKYGSDEYKFVKQAYFEYSAKAPVQVDVYVDFQAAPLFTFTLPASATRIVRRQRLPAVKSKIWRWVVTSTKDFQFYNESVAEFKGIGGPKGYQREPFMS
jgi:hypothetical protein